MGSAAILEVEQLTVGYQGGVVLEDLSVRLPGGDSLAVLGRNGVGKTTLVHAIMGLIPVSRGQIWIDGVDVSGQPAHVRANAGVAIVPQGRRVFLPLTVSENLRIAEKKNASEWNVDRVIDLMPRLGERRQHLASQLSGGEQQMLAIARALLREPRILLLDEPSEGLAPAVVDQVGEIIRGLLGTGLAALIVEQDLHLAFAVADRVAIVDSQQIAYEATVDQFRHDPVTAHRLLGVAG